MRKQAGFTAIELLITLFVAAAFLIAGYQLFNVVIKDGGQARAESRAANVAYDYMRRYSASATNPCAPQTLLTNSSVTIDGLTNTKITVAISCPDYSTKGVSKIDVTIAYNSPEQTVKYSTYVNGSGTQVGDITDGLIAWWKFNGDANTAVGTMNGTVTNAIPTLGQNGIDNNAYNFNGTNAKIAIPLTGLSTSIDTVTVTLWAKPVTSSLSCLLCSLPDDSTMRFNVYLPYTTDLHTYWHFGTYSTSGLTTPFTTSTYNTWSFWTFTISPSTGMKIYTNGSLVASSASSTAFTKGSKTWSIGFNGTSIYLNGSLDDLRLYGRVLSDSEILSIYSAGAK